MPAISTLVDDFTAALNTTVWNNITVGAATLDSTHGQVVLAVPTASGATNIFGANGPYDARSSALYAQITTAANGGGHVTTSMRLQADANNSVLLRVASGGVFTVVVTNAGTATTTTLPTYDPHQHRWWRLTETGGSWVCAASPDGLTWTTLATVPYTWSAAAAQAAFLTGATAAETAGNAAVIAHVNTRAGGQANPNWPAMEYGVGLLWGANAAAMPLDSYVDVSQRTADTTAAGGGRSYELDAMRSREATITLTNPAGDLDPTNAASPFAGRVQPFQPLRIRAQWPPTVNLLSRGVATGGDIGGAPLGSITPSLALDLASETDTTGGSVVTSTTAWMGSTVTQFSVPTGAAVGQRIVHSGQAAVLPGQAYTVTIHVRDVTASTTLQVKPHLGWVTAGSTTPSSYVYGTTATLTGSATAGWTTLTVTGTAPAGALGMDVGVTVAATAAATCTVQTDGWQQEKGSTASAWVCPGAWNPVYAGYTEDWQAKWGLSGTWSTVVVPAADAFSLLSQQTLSDPLTEEINSHSPVYLYTLADPSGSTSAADQTGARQPLPIAVAKQGAGTLSFGNAITAANTATGIYTGSTGTVATLANAGAGSATPSAASFLSLTQVGVKGPLTSTYTRMIAFRYVGATPSAQAHIWTALDGNHGAGTMLALFIDSTGKLNITSAGFSSSVTLTSTATVADGNWHLAVFGYQIGSTGQLFLSLDGVTVSISTDSTVFPSGLVGDSVGAFVDTTIGNSVKWNFSGDVSYIAEFPALLTPTDCTNLYSAWKSACAGESTDARYARILRYAGYTGTTSLQAGQTTSMGPASIGGQDAVSALQAVVDTENGEHFVDRAGIPTFKSRAARTSARTPVYVFGENTAAGEWPYEDVQPVWDSTHLGNQVTVTNGVGQNFYATDAASTAAYFPRTISRTVNASNPLEAQDAANYLLSRYKQPLTRIVSLTLNPSAIPAMWPVCLALELGTRVRVMRRPMGAPAQQIECFVENAQWSFGTDNTARLVLQCSPADTLTYAVWAAWHTTLAVSYSSGISTISLNAGQDNTNPLAAQLAAGQQLVIGQGTPQAETVTVQAVGATSPGWTTGAITLTTPLTQPHVAGDVVCEPLPAGVTDPTTYDYSAWDQVVYAY